MLQCILAQQMSGFCWKLSSKLRTVCCQFNITLLALSLLLELAVHSATHTLWTSHLSMGLLHLYRILAKFPGYYFTSESNSILVGNQVCFVAMWDEVTQQSQEKAGKLLGPDRTIGLWRVVLVYNLPFADQRRNGKIPKVLSSSLFGGF